jgi:hypothetical protein
MKSRGWIKIGLGFVGVFTLLTYALSRNVPPKPVAVAAVETPQQDQFDTAWLDVMKPLALKKGDMDRKRVLVPEPKVVTTVPVPVDTMEEPERLAPALTRKTKAVPTQRGHRDICSRHKMRKVITRNGKSWRCRK